MLAAVIIIVVGIAGVILVRRWWSHRENLKNLRECQAEYDVALADVTLADELSTQSDTMTTWIDMCHQLARRGHNPTLQYLHGVTNNVQAAELFRETQVNLRRILRKAEENLELARSFFPSEED